MDAKINDISVETPEGDGVYISIDSSAGLVTYSVSSMMLLADANGQVWRISVSTDGQLQTEKYAQDESSV